MLRITSPASALTENPQGDLLIAASQDGVVRLFRDGGLVLLRGSAPLLLSTTWLHIVSSPPDDQVLRDAFLRFVLRLPWIMTTDGDHDAAGFLALDGVAPISITIDGAPDAPDRAWLADVRLPPEPNILLFIPIDPPVKPEDATEGLEHLHALRAVLDPYYGDNFATKVRHVRTITELDREIGVGGFNAHIIYYYGHAGTQEGNTVLFLDHDPNQAALPAIDAVVTTVKKMTDRTRTPPVIWFNGCKTGLAQYGSCIREFAPMAATVIATRTLSAVRDSRQLGEIVLPQIAINGRSPQSALRSAIGKLPKETLRSARWTTTIVAVQYDMWSALEIDERLKDSGLDKESAGDIPLLLDRVKPLGKIAKYVSTHLPKALAQPLVAVWRGAPEQGLLAFERRFSDLLLEQGSDWSPVVRRIDLQLSGKSTSLKGTLDRNHMAGLLYGIYGRVANGHDEHISPQQLGQAIRNLLVTPRSVLVLAHGPFETPQGPLLEDYILFWKLLYPALGLHGMEQRALLGISFQDSTDAAFKASDICRVTLESIDVKGLGTHLKTFYHFYGIRPSEAESRLNERGGSFRSLYKMLREQLDIVQWKRLGDDDA